MLFRLPPLWYFCYSSPNEQRRVAYTCLFSHSSQSSGIPFCFKPVIWLRCCCQTQLGANSMRITISGPTTPLLCQIPMQTKYGYATEALGGQLLCAKLTWTPSCLLWWPVTPLPTTTTASSLIFFPERTGIFLYSCPWGGQID